jgi:hypothetical protein
MDCDDFRKQKTPSWYLKKTIGQAKLQVVLLNILMKIPLTTLDKVAIVPEAKIFVPLLYSLPLCWRALI